MEVCQNSALSVAHSWDSLEKQQLAVGHQQLAGLAKAVSGTFTIVFGRTIVVAQHKHRHVRDVTTAINEQW